MDEIKLEVKDIFSKRYFAIIQKHLTNTTNAIIELDYNEMDIPKLSSALRIIINAPYDILLKEKENSIKMILNNDFNYTAITNVEYMENRSTHVDMTKNKCRIFNCTNSITDKEKLLNYCLAEKILLAIKSIA